MAAKREPLKEINVNNAALGPATPRIEKSLRMRYSTSPASSGYASSQTRSSSSPPSLTGMRNPPEIYDISAGDGESGQTPQSTPQPDPRSLRIAWAVSKVSPERKKFLLRELGAVHTDAWTLDDWGGPRCLYERMETPDRPCSDEARRNIASAVRAEVQVELEAIVQRVTSRMTAQVQVDVEKLHQQDETMQTSFASLSLQVKELQTSFQEHRRIATKRLEVLEDCGQVAYERAAINLLPQRTALTPSAGETVTQRCCARLDAIESFLRKHLDSFEVMVAQNSKFSNVMSMEYKKLASKVDQQGNDLKKLSHVCSEHETESERTSAALRSLQVSVRNSEVDQLGRSKGNVGRPNPSITSMPQMKVQQCLGERTPPPTSESEELSRHCFDEDHAGQFQYITMMRAKAKGTFV